MFRNCLQNFVLVLILSYTVTNVAYSQNQTEMDSIVAVVSKFERKVTFVNPKTLKEIFQIPVPGGPHELTVSKDGKFVFVANYHQSDNSPGHSISIIDVDSGKEIKKIELGALLMPHGIIYRDDKLYFTSELTRTVGRYNISTNSIDWIRGTGQSLSHILALSPDNKYLFVTNMHSDSVTAIEIGANGQNPAGFKQIPVGSHPEGIAVSPDGKEIWVGHNGDGNISIIDSQTLTVKKIMKVGEVPIRLKFTKDGKKIVIVDPKGSDLIIYDSVSHHELKRFPIFGGPVSFALSPDETHAFVSLIHAAKAILINLENGKILGEILTGTAPDGIIWFSRKAEN